MRRNRKSRMITTTVTAIVALGLLAGCSQLFHPTEEKINKSIGKAAAIGDKVQGTAFEWIEQVKKDGIHSSLSLTQEVGSASGVVFNHEVGNIEITSTSSDKVTVKTTIWTKKNSPLKSDHQAILDKAETSAIVKGDILEILTHSKDDSKLDIWAWAQKKYGNSDFFIDYEVELPATVTHFEVSNNVGEINLRNLEGTYRIHNNVGSIHIEGAHITGDSDIQSDTGSLQLGIEQIEPAGSLKASTEIGSIHAVLASTLECDLKTKSELGQITGASNGPINGGGPLLSLSTAIGSINVDRS